MTTQQRINLLKSHGIEYTWVEGCIIADDIYIKDGIECRDTVNVSEMTTQDFIAWLGY